MKKNIVITAIVLSAIITFVPLDVFAKTTDFGGEAIAEQTTKIQGFLFGPAMRITGVLGGAYGLIQAILSSSLKPLIVFGGIGLAVNIIPKFIDGIYGVSGMMLP